MANDHPLTLTVEQAGQVLGVGRSTAYELVRSGDLKSIRLRRRIVVPVAHLAESLGVDREALWASLPRDAEEHSDPVGDLEAPKNHRRTASTTEGQTLF